MNAFQSDNIPSALKRLLYGSQQHSDENKNIAHKIKMFDILKN